jgi:hypothetical protein
MNIYVTHKYIYIYISVVFYSRESIRALEEEGLIYSTIDEFHYKSTACG